MTSEDLEKLKREFALATDRITLLLKVLSCTRHSAKRDRDQLCRWVERQLSVCSELNIDLTDFHLIHHLHNNKITSWEFSQTMRDQKFRD